MNNNAIKINNLNELFSYSYNVLNKHGKPCYIQIKDINFRYKKEVKEYIKRGATIDDLSDYISTINKSYKLVLIQTYQYFCLYELRKDRSYLKNNEKPLVIKFDLKQFDDDNKYSDLD